MRSYKYVLRDVLIVIGLRRAATRPGPITLAIEVFEQRHAAVEPCADVRQRSRWRDGVSGTVELQPDGAGNEGRGDSGDLQRICRLDR